jgi:NlpE N-terminal domain
VGGIILIKALGKISTVWSFTRLSGLLASTLAHTALGPARPAALGALPATFIGELPCADCPAIRYQLNLYPDRAFFSCMIYLGRGDDTTFDDIGSWIVSSDQSIIVLKGGRDALRCSG